MWKIKWEPLLKCVISACVFYVIWKKITHTETVTWIELFHQFPHTFPWWIAAMVFIPINLGCETIKWKLLLEKWYVRISFRQLFSATLTGMSLGIFTPNRLGEYAGRLAYLPHSHRPEAVAMTFLCRLAQTLPTAVIGAISLYFLLPDLIPQHSSIFTHYAYPLVLTVNILVFFFWLSIKYWNSILSTYLKHFPLIHRFLHSIQLTESRKLLHISLWSFARYGIFTFQYYLLLRACGYEGGIEIACICISSIFFLKSLVPSIALTEWGIREIVAIHIMSLYDIPLAIAISSTFLLYLFNVILPAFIGTLLMYGKTPIIMNASSISSLPSKFYTPGHVNSD